MLSYFCPKCGGKNLYQFQKPKFCSNCGSNFLESSAQNFTNIKSNQFEVSINNKKNTNLDNDNDEPIQDYSSMRGLDVHIEKYNNNDGIKLGELVSDEPVRQQISANKKSVKVRRGRKKIAKSLPQSFVSEAKMSGRNYQDNNDSIQDIEE